MSGKIEMCEKLKLLSIKLNIMANRLYFIENIHTISLSEEEKDVKYVITLEDVKISEEIAQRELDQERFDNERRDGEERVFFTQTYSYLPRLNNSHYVLHEGQYVYQDTETGDFEAAYNDPLAKSRLNKNLRLRNKLISLLGDNERDEERVKGKQAFGKNAHVESYHVNVGHGNCTLIFIRKRKEYELWMVDCGGIDMLNRQCYYSNILACLADIASKLNIPQADLYISKLFLTHWHYDHISGFQLLVKNGFINKHTQCYINLYYAHSSQCANDMLAKLVQLGLKCYEPTASLPIPAVTILHPECRIRKKVHPYDTTPCRIVTKANDASVVYAVTIGGETMILPGDLEKNGWDAMTSAATCQKHHLCTTNYYCVSHHGSMTGHVDIPCLERNHYPKVGNCIKAGPLQKAILMGRDGAYPGIYNNGVVNYWGNILRYSEHDDQNNSRCAYVLEWGLNNERYL